MSNVTATATLADARAIALANRQTIALSKLYRFSGGVVESQGDRLERGHYTHRLHSIDHNGRNVYGLIEGEDATEALSAWTEGKAGYYPGEAAPLKFAPYSECAKLVFDAAVGLPTVVDRHGAPTVFA